MLRHNFGLLAPPGDDKLGVLKLSYLSMFRQPALLRVLGQVVEAEAAQGLVGGSVLPQELQLADRHQVRVFPHLDRRRRRRRDTFTARFTDLFGSGQTSREGYSYA